MRTKEAAIVCPRRRTRGIRRQNSCGRLGRAHRLLPIGRGDEARAGRGRRRSVFGRLFGGLLLQHQIDLRAPLRDRISQLREREIRASQGNAIQP